MTRVKTTAEINAMREGGAMLAHVLKALAEYVEPGLSTKELAVFAQKELAKLGGKPAFLGYYGFPDVLCVSLNDEVVHGIPREDRIIQNGDIVSMDFGVLHKGLITDAAISVIAGKARSEDVQLVAKTKQAMEAAIDVVRDGVKTGTIGAAAEAILSKAHYGIVRDYVGHGVGHELHEEPNVPNFGIKGEGVSLTEGMTIAIEPMATRGSHDVFVAADNWTVKTKDGSRAAHFENTVLITKDGAEVLTA
ncbi:type I methionyl aminopeptidase [Candidatus Saccharibacteria bacterium]|nr:type I methionyl aminopeptidase [Candidatus Saccharibacteria bacterium]MCA9337674.1 type I methionyl aminopeptidase [Candidatus Saccharibacteria bacterium]